LTLNRRIKNQLKKLKKIIDKLEKKLVKNKKRVDNWTKRVRKKSITFFRSYFNLSVDIASSIRNFYKKFEIKIFIKSEKKIKRIIIITTKNIVNWARKIDVNKTLFARKNIEIIKRRLKLLIFRIKTKNNKKILKKNNFWIKKISLNASLREASYNIVVHKIKIKKMLKNIKKKKTKMFIKINKNIYLKITIEKIE